MHTHPTACSASFLNSRRSSAGIAVLQAVNIPVLYIQMAEPESPQVKFRKPLPRQGLITESGSEASQPVMSPAAAVSRVTRRTDRPAPQAVAPHPPSSGASRYHPLLEMEAAESGCEEGESSSCGSENDSISDDSDLSCIVDDDVDQNVSPGMQAVYAQSLCSQGKEIGFGTPMHLKRMREMEDDGCAPSSSIVTGILKKHEARHMRRRLRVDTGSGSASDIPVNPVQIPAPLTDFPVAEVRHAPLGSFFALSCVAPQPFVRGTGIFSGRCKLRKAEQP